MTVQQSHRRDSFGILLIPQFPIYVLTMVVESLRLANNCLNTSTYDWRIITQDGQPAAASNGMRVTPEASIREVAHLGTLVVISGFEPEQAFDADLLGWIRKSARLGTRIGGIDTGAFILAKAGLLEACPVTVHWQSMAAFEEAFPYLETTDALFTISGIRFTCAGGAASLDLMLNLIALDQGYALAQKVAQDFVHDHIRGASEGQRIVEDHRWKHSNPALAKYLEIMEQNLEEPLPIGKLVELSGRSRRQLERIFSRDLGTTPMRHYLLMRLNKARQLILHSQISIHSTALACGFSSLSVFSRAYRTQFGNSPSEHRTLFKAQGLGSRLSQRIKPLSIDARLIDPSQTSV